MKNYLWVVILLLQFLAVQSSAQGKEHRVVIQFTNATDTMQQKALTNQLNNLRAHWPDATIEVVAFNQGVDYLLSSKVRHQEAIMELKKSGVRFIVCENTMKHRKLNKTDFIPEAEFVKAGIAEIVERQEEGWSYIVGGF